MQEEIIEKLRCAPAQIPRLDTCFETTSALRFWLFDPPNSKARIEFLAKAKALDVRCNTEFERTLAAVDRCLISDEAQQKCDAILFWRARNKWQVYWIELKMNLTTQKEVNIAFSLFGEKEALDQILNTRKILEGAGLDCASWANTYFIGIPPIQEKRVKKSPSLQRKREELRRKDVFVFFGSVLALP